jgi:Mg-chelatase subunit ChlD
MRRARALAATLLFVLPAGVARPSLAGDFRLSQAVQGRRPTQVLAYLDVRDDEGKPVTALDPSSITATLGEQSLQVGRVVPFREAGEGVAFIFCVDISKSLSAADFAAVRSALGRWIDGMRPLDRAAVLSFGEESRLAVDFTADKSALRLALDALGPTDMLTVFYRGLRDALELSSRRDSAVPGRRVLVVLSDGKDEGSGLAAEDVVVALRERGLPLYAIGFGGPRRQDSLDLLQRFANNSGGDFVAVGGGDFENAYAAMRETIDQVWVAELDCPSCEADGSARRLQVNLRLADRVLSEGADLRLLPPLETAAPAGATEAAGAPAPSAQAARAGASAAAETGEEETPSGLLWPAIGVGALLALAGLALAVRRFKRPPAQAGVAAPAKRRRARQHLTRRERKQLDIPLDSEPLVPTVALCLTVVRGAAEGSEHRFLLERRAVLGSGGKSQFVIDEPELAAEQVELVQQDGGVFARNLSRSHPTLVNGATLVESKPIRSGDLLGNRGFIARVRLG